MILFLSSLVVGIGYVGFRSKIGYYVGGFSVEVMIYIIIFKLRVYLKLFFFSSW